MEVNLDLCITETADAPSMSCQQSIFFFLCLQQTLPHWLVPTLSTCIFSFHCLKLFSSVLRAWLPVKTTSKSLKSLSSQEESSMNSEAGIDKSFSPFF